MQAEHVFGHIARMAVLTIFMKIVVDGKSINVIFMNTNINYL